MFDYKSPIKLIMGEMETKYTEDAIEVVRSYGFDVDKEELIKALNYDRNQYEKGYAKGLEDFVDWYMACDFEYDREFNSFYRSEFDGHAFIEASYSKDDLIKLFKESNR